MTVLCCAVSIYAGPDLFRRVQTVVISSIKLQAEQADGRVSQEVLEGLEWRRGWREEGPLFYSAISPGPCPPLMELSPPPQAVCITIDLGSGLTPAGEPGDLIKGPFLTHLGRDNVKTSKFRHIANK